MMMIQHSSTRKRVVIVDDSRTMQAVLEQMLAAHKLFEIVGIASDGISAVSMIHSLKPDLVTIDLMMPYIDGTQLLQELAVFPDMKKVIISANACNSVAMMAKLHNLGADACLSKADMSKDADKLAKVLFDVLRPPKRKLPKAHNLGDSGIPCDRYPVPSDERDRLLELRRLNIANDNADASLDLLTEHLATTTRFPACIITFIDRQTQWVKSGYGFERGSMDRSQAICNFTICGDEAFIVADTLADARFNKMDVVQSGVIRSYVGCPIIDAAGVRLGAICLLDVKPRAVSLDELRNLRGMARIAARFIENGSIRQAA